jgi:hypothetical protein
MAVAVVDDAWSTASSSAFGERAPGDDARANATPGGAGESGREPGREVALTEAVAAATLPGGVWSAALAVADDCCSVERNAEMVAVAMRPYHELDRERLMTDALASFTGLVIKSNFDDVFKKVHSCPA